MRLRLFVRPYYNRWHSSLLPWISTRAQYILFIVPIGCKCAEPDDSSGSTGYPDEPALNNHADSQVPTRRHLPEALSWKTLISSSRPKLGFRRLHCAIWVSSCLVPFSFSSVHFFLRFPFWIRFMHGFVAVWMIHILLGFFFHSVLIPLPTLAYIKLFICTSFAWGCSS